ncbi:FadR/GntR family transcriptional regulator [Acidisoma sp. L85]|uniref:FadR/GntR family transcriptional regulator n=1 Tax=Acidisoma sp. L85 TaxID=1641850 RepID=UPI00131C55A6|nr:FCD domain-containing protein [Acidisoma sp. L85]
MSSEARDREPSGPVNGPPRGDAESLRKLLGQEIGSSRWRIGDKLPTERELGETYGVARNTVRRALQVLEQEKLIIRHVGRGTFKAGDASSVTSAFLPSAGSLSPAGVVECRLIFEPELAHLAVARATQVDLDRLAQCLRGGETATTVEDFERWDGALHEAIAQATHNQTIVAMAQALAVVRTRGEWGQLKARSMTVEHRRALHAQHANIVASLIDRDRDAARTQLREHILYVRKYMFGE